MMANPEHFDRLRDGVESWNRWRRSSDLLRPDLSGVELPRQDLSGADLSDSILTNSFLVAADLVNANLSRADLSGSDLAAVDFSFASLAEATLVGCNLDSAILRKTILNHISLKECLGLHRIVHYSHSYMDAQAIVRSDPLPDSLLRACGMDSFCASQEADPDYLSCFISYSRRDEEVALLLHQLLVAKRVPCWIDQKNLGIGNDLFDTISMQVRSAGRVIVLLSENSIGRPWIEREIKFALSEEIERQERFVLPLALDDHVFLSKKEWVRELRGRHVGDMRAWREPDVLAETVRLLLMELSCETCKKMRSK